MEKNLDVNTIETGSRSEVSTFEQLRTALSEDNGITEVELTSDITFTAGIRIHRNKETVIIDGQNHTITENASSSWTGNMYIDNSTTPRTVTLKNVNIIGRDYYGTIAISAPDVTYNLENITYTGPQFIYNPQGYANFSGTNNFVIQESQGTTGMQEFAEVAGVSIEGEFNLTTFTTGGYSAFWFAQTTSRPPIFNVKSGAKVNIDSKARQIFYSGQKVNMTIGTAAEVTMTTPQPIFDSGWLGNLTLGENASFIINRFGQNWLSYPTLRLDGQLKILPNATFVINNASETTATALATAAQSYVQFDNPQLIDLVTHGNAHAIAFVNSTFSFTTDCVSEWVGSEEEEPTFISDPLDAMLSINNLNKKVIYSNQVDVFDHLSLTNANRLQFKKLGEEK